MARGERIDAEQAGGASISGGLTSGEVQERVSRGEVNVTDLPTSRPFSSILSENVFTFFNAILTVAFIAILVLGDIRDGFFYAVVVFNALIGIVQEVRAKLALDRLALVAAPETAVVRDGAVAVIDPAQIVLGDTVVVRPGDQITADAVVIDASSVLVDESLLTGESEPVAKQAGDALLSGSHVVAGSGLATVTAVGNASYSGTLAAEIKRHRLVRSELREATNRILVYLSWGLLPLIAIVITGRILTYGGPSALGNLADGDWRSALLDTVAGVVGMIPEGLVLLTSLAFGVAAIQLSRERVLVQELAAVEVLARVDVLCLDKTGTLTTGEIVFEQLLAPSGHPLDDDDAVRCHAALSAFGSDPAANATARALLARFGQTAIETDRLPFDSARAFGAIAVDGGSGGESTTWLLGAPERLLGDQHATVLARANELATSGSRTLVLAAGSHEPARYGEDPGLVSAAQPMGLVVFREEVRPDAAATLSFFAEQGVRVIVLSGDNPRTVGAIAEELGLQRDAIDASTLRDSDELAAALESTSVFGRVAPSQKREVVRLLQADGRTVAMTGDGVNDAMAIKEADLGIAMGNATPVTRAVSRLVLLDSRFDRMPDLLAYGRRVIANVERVANLFLAKTVYGIVFALVSSVFLWEFPFLPRQLTLVSVLAIGIPSFFLALAPNRRRYRHGVLRRILWFSIPVGVIASLACVLAYAPLRAALPLNQARSLVTICLFIVSLWILVVLARPFTAARYALVGGVTAAMAIVCSVPLARGFFSLDLPISGWLGFAIGVGALGAVGIELCYRIARRRGIVSDRQ